MNVYCIIYGYDILYYYTIIYSQYRSYFLVHTLFGILFFTGAI